MTRSQWFTCQICCLLFCCGILKESQAFKQARFSTAHTHTGRVGSRKKTVTATKEPFAIHTLYRHCRIFRFHLWWVHSTVAFLPGRPHSSRVQIVSMLLEPIMWMGKKFLWNWKNSDCCGHDSWPTSNTPRGQCPISNFKIPPLTLSISCKRTRMSSSS